MISSEIVTACSEALEQAGRISIMRRVLEEPAITLALEVIASAARQEDAPAAGAELFRALAEKAELSTQPIVGSAWQNALVESILGDDNPFTRKAEMGKFSEAGRSLLEQTRFDLTALRTLYDLDFDPLLGGFASISRVRCPCRQRT